MVREVLDVMLELADSGQTMLIVTHEMQFARAIADQVIMLEDGASWNNPTTPKRSSPIRKPSVPSVSFTRSNSTWHREAAETPTEPTGTSAE